MFYNLADYKYANDPPASHPVPAPPVAVAL